MHLLWVQTWRLVFFLVEQQIVVQTFSSLSCQVTASPLHVPVNIQDEQLQEFNFEAER